ncbi:hypothetical protein VTK56DRAFT_8635 [Thermocarpiscus australiensis]
MLTIPRQNNSQLRGSTLKVERKVSKHANTPRRALGRSSVAPKTPAVDATPRTPRISGPPRTPMAPTGNGQTTRRDETPALRFAPHGTPPPRFALNADTGIIGQPFPAPGYPVPTMADTAHGVSPMHAGVSGVPIGVSGLPCPSVAAGRAGGMPIDGPGMPIVGSPMHLGAPVGASPIHFGAGLPIGASPMSFGAGALPFGASGVPVTPGFPIPMSPYQFPGNLNLWTPWNSSQNPITGRAVYYQDQPANPVDHHAQSINSTDYHAQPANPTGDAADTPTRRGHEQHQFPGA